MGGSGWFAKGTKLSWISNYCISLIEIQSKLKTVSRSQAIVYGRTHVRRTPRHGISSSGLWPVELKIKRQNILHCHMCHMYDMILRKHVSFIHKYTS